MDPSRLMKTFLPPLYLLSAVISIFTVFISGPAISAGDGWVDDPAVAMERASRENKQILIDFTGSDWCGWCMKLVQEVFSHKEFSDGILTDFVLLEVDFPAHKPQTDEIKARNKALAEKYGVRGYPTIVLADSKGVEFARTGYRAGGPVAYLEHLKSLKAGASRLEALTAEAAGAKGIDRALILDETLSLMDTLGRENGRDKIIEEIKSLDKDGVGGLKFKYAMREKITAILSSPEITADPSGADMKLADIEKSMKGMVELFQEVLFYRAMIAMNSGDSQSAIGLLKQVIGHGAYNELGMRAADAIKDLESAVPAAGSK